MSKSNEINNFKDKDDTMQNQIFSMLKGVGVIEDDDLEFHENINDIKETLFGDDDLMFDFDDAETNHNTTISQGTFLRNQNEKSLTLKNENMIFNFNNQESRRRKFNTQNYISNYSFNPINNNNLNDSFGYQIPQNCFIYNNNILNNQYNYFNQINNINLSLNYNNNNNSNNNNNNNLNSIPVTTTPLGMKMPIRTFNFKIKNQNQSNFSFPNLKNNLIKNNINKHDKSFFYYQAQKQNQDKKQQNNFLLNENIAKELEGMLIEKGFFTQKIYDKLKGKFISLMKTQQTSRILQYYLDQTPENIIHQIFFEFKDIIDELILDIYANYFCLKIFYFLNKEDRIIFLKNISNNLDNLSVNKISTYPIQCIIEKLNYEEEFEIVFNGIKNNLMKLSVDIYGTHVLEKILNTFNYEKYIIHISNFIIDNFIFLVNNSNGLCIVKKIIIIENKRKKINNINFQKIKKYLIDNSIILIQNPFGNYALQTAIDNWELEDLIEIMEPYKGKLLILSIQKFSSNVIERCIEKNEKFLFYFIKEISSDDNSIILLMKNNYGNYVIQTALRASKINKQIQNILINSMKNNLVNLNDKKLINKWKIIITSYSKN